MRRMLALLVVVLVVAAACADDGGDESAENTGSDSTNVSEAYADELVATVATLQRAGDSAFEPVDLAVAADDTETAMVEAQPAADAMIAAVDEARTAIEGLDPPAEYQSDQRTVLQVLADIEQILAELAAVAEQGEAEVFIDRLADLERVRAAGDANVSPAIVGRLAMATTLVEDFSELTDEELAYLGAVNGAFLEFASRNARFSQALNQSYSDTTALLRALVDAGAGSAWAAVREPVQALTPPEGLAEDHEHLTTYLDEAVEADAAILAAADSGDFIGFLVANEDLASSARTAAGEVSAPTRRAAFPFGPMPPETIEGDDRAREIWGQAALLADLFQGGDFPGYRPFSIATDEDTVRAMVEIAPQRQEWLAQVADDLAEVEDPATGADDVSGLIRYVDDLQALHVDLAAVAGEDDVEAALDVLDELAATWCAAGAELNPRLGAVVAVHLGPTATDTRCAS